MEFVVPQFIEKEPKIVGPFTFKQFIFIGTAGGISLMLYFFLPFILFLITAGPLLILAFILAFAKINRTSLPQYIANFFNFIFRPKIYLWKKKSGGPKFLRSEEKIIKQIAQSPDREESKLKVSRNSRLDELLTRIETK